MTEVIHQQLKNTPITHLHIDLGAKMGNFVGFNMPLVYSSVNEEHINVRNNIGLFDVSHMGEFYISGPKAFESIQNLTTNDVSRLSPGKAQYSSILNENGGIIDDLLVYHLAENEYMLVVNGGNLSEDWEWIKAKIDPGCQMEDRSSDTGLIAVQGPKASSLLKRLTSNDVENIKYYTFEIGEVAGVPDVLISATGYTGSGGFELYCKADETEKIWNSLMELGADLGVKPAGLAARNTLRLEMGYCLHGNDIDKTTTPLEAGLSWICRFNSDFIGKNVLVNQKENGLQRKLVGFVMQERGIAREGYKILTKSGEEIGEVTSGSYSPSLEQNIGLGYVPLEYSTDKSEIYIQVRKKQLLAQVTKLPFYNAD